MLDTGCWMLDTGLEALILVDGCYKVDAEYWIMAGYCNM